MKLIAIWRWRARQYLKASWTVKEDSLDRFPGISKASLDRRRRWPSSTCSASMGTALQLCCGHRQRSSEGPEHVAAAAWDRRQPAFAVEPARSWSI